MQRSMLMMENEFPIIIYAFQMNYAVDLAYENCSQVFGMLGFNATY